MGVPGLDGGVHADKLFFKFLRNGGSEEMNVNGSVTPAAFEFSATGKTHLITHLVVHIQDGGITPTEFAGLGSALSNGLLISVYDTDGTTELLDITDGHPITDNGEFAHLQSEAPVITVPAAGDDDLHAVIDFEGGLLLDPGQSVRVTVRDDLTAVTEFHMLAHGRKLP
jgi:hypothetical protein